MKAGNRCDHDPNNPRLAAAVTITKGKGGMPRILSLAAERVKSWYLHPRKCPPLAGAGRRKRSERREAYQRIIEAILYYLDLASLCCGKPTPGGFVDVDMAALVEASGMNQRRCERAIADLVAAGLLKVKQPRRINDQGAYVGLRAIRIVTVLFFEYLGLAPMLARERARATRALQRKAAKSNKKLSDLMARLSSKMNTRFRPTPPPTDEQLEARRAWGLKWGEFVKNGIDPPEAQRLTNLALGYPPYYSPGQEFSNTRPRRF